MKKICVLILIVQTCHVQAMLLAASNLLRKTVAQKTAHVLVGSAGSARSMGSLGVRLPRDTFALPAHPDWDSQRRVLDFLVEDYNERLAVQREAGERVSGYLRAEKKPSWFALNAVAYGWSEGELSYFICKDHMGMSKSRLTCGEITQAERAEFDAFRAEAKQWIKVYVQCIRDHDRSGLIEALHNMGT